MPERHQKIAGMSPEGTRRVTVRSPDRTVTVTRLNLSKREGQAPWPNHGRRLTIPKREGSPWTNSSSVFHLTFTLLTSNSNSLTPRRKNPGMVISLLGYFRYGWIRFRALLVCLPSFEVTSGIITIATSVLRYFRYCCFRFRVLSVCNIRFRLLRVSLHTFQGTSSIVASALGYFQYGWIRFRLFLIWLHPIQATFGMVISVIGYLQSVLSILGYFRYRHFRFRLFPI